MKVFKLGVMPLMVTAICCSKVLLAAEPATAPLAKAPPLVALSPEHAGPDFAIQGEYRGTYTEAGGKLQSLGVQVAALGEGKFKAIFLPGGLPGAGWVGGVATEIEGQNQNGEITFKADGAAYSATLTNGIFSGQTGNGEKFNLQKVTRTSPTLGQPAPEKALILFDGSRTDAWERGFTEARKLLVVHVPKPEQDPNGFFRELEKAPIGGGPITKQKFGDFSMHLEFMLPFKPASRGQGRGNSGVYIQQRYEVQILDSFGFKLLDAKPTGDVCGEIYKQQIPKVNMSFPPLSWQTYDIDFKQPQWSADGQKLQNAFITVRHNGVVIHDNYSITAKTGAGKSEAPEAGPILLQGHGEPIVFRNIWIVPKP